LIEKIETATTWKIEKVGILTKLCTLIIVSHGHMRSVAYSNFIS